MADSKKKSAASEPHKEFKGTTSQRGRFKELIHEALFKSEPIKEMLLGDTTNMSEVNARTEFKHYVKSHLFIDDTVNDEKTFIFYDVELSNIHNQIKDCRIWMYLICHRNILEDYTVEGYYGDRIDILSQMVEDALINDVEVSDKFGIGKLTLDSVSIYNATRFYGCTMQFSVPTFR